MLTNGLDSVQAAPVQAPAAGVPHASEAYHRMLAAKRNEAGADRITRCEAALFALLYGPGLSDLELLIGE